jgi:hypothetical protein
MREIESLVEAYLVAERDLVAAVDAAGGEMPLPDGRAITVGRAEFDALLSERRRRAWVDTVERVSCRPPLASWLWFWMRPFPKGFLVARRLPFEAPTRAPVRGAARAGGAPCS